MKLKEYEADDVDLNVHVVLAKLKRLVSRDQFVLVNRRAIRAHAVTRTLAKEIVAQLLVSDFRKRDQNYDIPGEFVWFFKTEYGAVYYLKFKFINDGNYVKFISFHLND